MKAVLLARKVDFPLTHDLEALMDIGQRAGITIPENLLDIDTLTPYAVETRYPGYGNIRRGCCSSDRSCRKLFGMGQGSGLIVKGIGGFF